MREEILQALARRNTIRHGAVVAVPAVLMGSSGDHAYAQTDPTYFDVQDEEIAAEIRGIILYFSPDLIPPEVETGAPVMVLVRPRQFLKRRPKGVRVEPRS